MTEIAKSYRFRVADLGATAVTGNVDWTETTGDDEGPLKGIGEVGGQEVNPLKGTTSGRPWTVEIVDYDGTITGRLSDSDGRAHLLRRLADLSVSTDGGSTWTVIATARIDDVEMSDSLSSYIFTMQDERSVERATTIFKAGNTTRVIPHGLNEAWLIYQPPGTKRWTSGDVDGGNSTTGYQRGGDSSAGFTQTETIDDTLIRLLEEDIIDDPAPDQGNFSTFRANINGTDREIESLGPSFDAADPLRALRRDGRFSYFTVAGFADTTAQSRAIYFHFPGRDPSPELPLHIGGQVGIDPFTLVKDIYDGDYQQANPSTVRYDSDAFSAYDPSTNPNGLIDNPRFPKMHFRITGPDNMQRWLDENIYGPLGVTPFVNEEGEVSPRITTLPASDQVPDPDNLTELTAANLTSPHPGWKNTSRELVTETEIEFEYAVAPSYVSLSRGLFSGLWAPQRVPTRGEEDEGTGYDLLITKTRTMKREHDRAQHHRALRKMSVRGIHRVIEQARFTDEYSQKIFNRFGDGPIYSHAAPFASASGPTPGDWVKLSLSGSYPALQNQSRTGSRVAQVIERIDTIAGARYKLLEAGPSSQPLSDPSIALAANSNTPEHAVDVTVSSLNSGEGYEVHLSVGDTEPDEEDPDWQYRHVYGDGNETVTVRGLPAGETIWGRVRATAPDRISSDWSSADDQATTGLTAPSSLADSNVTGDAATVTWTNGETDYDVMVDLIVTSGGAQAIEPVRLPAGTTQHRFVSIPAQSTGYTSRAWHVDDFGGESSKGTDTLTTTGTAETLPRLFAILRMVGGLP